MKQSRFRYTCFLCSSWGCVCVFIFLFVSHVIMSCCLIFVTTLLSWKEPINLFVWIKKNFTSVWPPFRVLCTSIKWINNSVKLHQKKLTPLSKTMRGKTFVQSKHCPFDEYVEIPEKNQLHNGIRDWNVSPGTVPGNNSEKTLHNLRKSHHDSIFRLQN